jgi:hypothetical protein
MPNRSLIYPLFLLVGSLMAVAAGVLHPDLVGDGPAQLAQIARSNGWRAIHWTFLFSFPLALTGLVGLARAHAGSPGEDAVRAATIVVTFAYAGWMVIVAFMGGAAWSLAQSFVAAEPGMTATRAVFLYDMLRPFALAAQRVAGFALGLATALFGWGVLSSKMLQGWVGPGGIVAGAAGVVLAVAFPEDTKADQAAFVLPVVWQVVAGVTFLRGVLSDSRSSPVSAR